MQRQPAQILHLFSLCMIFCLILWVMLFGICTASKDPFISEINRQTMASCKSREDCEGDLECFGFIKAASIEVYGPCRNDAKNCRCVSRKAVYCESSSDFCPRSEGCARSLKTSRTFCVSCPVILDPTSQFEPVDKNVCVSSPTPTPFPSPTSRPNYRRKTADFCSLTSPCAKSLPCVDQLSGKPCESFSSACTCGEKRRYKSCSKPGDCRHPAETCVMETNTFTQFCASCNLLSINAFIIPSNSNDQKCSKHVGLPPPVYNGPGDGRTLDDCTSDKHCHRTLKCSPDNVDAFCRDSIGIPGTPKCRRSELVSCKSTNDCLRGEACAHVRCLGVVACVSRTFLNTLSWDAYSYVGEPPRRIGRRNGNTGESCGVNIHCRNGLKCIHRDGNYSPCANRRSCQCSPLTYAPCSTDSECRSGEICVNYADARNRPFCYSRRALDSTYLLQPFNSTVARNAQNGFGWTLDACTSSSECKDQHVCSHFAEPVSQPCLGRNGCVCKYSGEKSVLDGFQQCQDVADCGKGEICIRPIESALSYGQCISRKARKRQPFSSSYTTL